MALGLDFSAWSIVGFVGTAFFSTRFLTQWIASERRGESVLPVAFWWYSIAGSVLMAVYFIGRRDPVGIVAYLPNLVVYVRNLQLTRKRKRERAAGPVAPPPVAAVACDLGG